MALMQAATGAASSANFNATTTAIDLALARALGAGVISGLTVDGTGTVQTGEALIGHVVALTVATLPTYVASATNYVYLQMPAAPLCVGSNGKDAGVVIVNQTGTLPVNSVLLASVVTGTGASITSVNTNPAGRVTLTLPLSLPPFAPLGNSGTTLTVDLSVASTQSLTLTGNATLTLTNGMAGRVYRLLLLQDASGSRTVTWPGTLKWPGGTAPTLTTTPAKTDIVEMLFDGTNFYSRAIGLNY